MLARLSDRYGAVRFTGIDVTRAALDKHRVERGKVRFAQGSAVSLPFSDSSFDFVYSSQVLEHLHPDDVPTHLAEVGRVLRPGGWLGFDTPNRATGPHDVSRGFTRTATGLHLKEWTYRELIRVLHSAGLERIQTRVLPGRVAKALSLRPPGLVLPALLKVLLEDKTAWEIITYGDETELPISFMQPMPV